MASQFCGRTRREFLWQAGAGFGATALSGILPASFFGGQSLAADGATPFRNPLASRPPHFAPQAKSVIFLFMYGGPSQIDTFDYKPEMKGRDNQTVKVKTFGRGGHKNEGRIVEPRWNFKQYGQCGKWVSDLFPHLGQCVDDIAFLHSMTADSPIHGSAMLMMNSGRILSGFPCLGSWATYGLGSENENLPGFVVMLDSKGGPISGAKNWSSGFMPATYQGTILRTQGAPILDLNPPPGMSRESQRIVLDHLRAANEEHERLRPGHSDLAARIASYELAFKMQQFAPEAVDFSQETAATHTMYGLDNARTADFGRKCMLARRLVERGVRFVQIFAGKGTASDGSVNDVPWDCHSDLETNHRSCALHTDQPAAALLTDLAARGLLESTLVIWGGEFGRTSDSQGSKGRDHNPNGFTIWLVGPGVRGGLHYGATDDFGYKAVEKKIHVNDLHATLLRLLGLEHTRLTYRFNGRDFRLTDVGGNVLSEILV
jgi:hypothetical protein